jgi:hypothetical protein
LQAVLEQLPAELALMALTARLGLEEPGLLKSLVMLG